MQKHEKSILLMDLITNRAKVILCKEHSTACQGFCLQDKSFVCFHCLMKNHQGHQVITIEEIDEKAVKTKTVLQKAQKARDSKQFELKNSLEAETKRQKRLLDEIFDPEISSLSLLKKKLYKEVDIRIMSEKEHYEHQLLSQNLSKFCSSTEKMLQDWNQTQEANLAIQILKTPLEEEPQGTRSYENQVDIFKAEITKKHAQSMSKILKSFKSTRHSSVKSNKLLAPNRRIEPTQRFLQVELDYLANVFQVYGLTASHKNGFLELKADSISAFTSNFDPIYFTCSLYEISLKCLDVLPSPSFTTICQILQNIHELKDVTLHFPKINNSDLVVLWNLISNLKTLEKFKVQMDLTDISLFGVSEFIENLANIKNLFSLDIHQNKPYKIISFQLTQSPVPPAQAFTVLQEISLGLDCLPEAWEILHMLNSSQAKSLQILKLSLGKTKCETKVMETVREALRLQSDLQELILTVDELSESTSSDLSVLLSESTQKKKLEIFIDKVLIRDNSTKFLPKAHPTLQDLEEFTFKFKYDRGFTVIEHFAGLVDFLSSLKVAKKLCLQFDGIESTSYCCHRLFSKIGKLKTLEALEIEYIDLYGLPFSHQRVFENILNKLPDPVTKKVTFKRSDFRYNDWDDISEYSGYSDGEINYLEEDGDDDEEEVDE